MTPAPCGDVSRTVLKTLAITCLSLVCAIGILFVAAFNCGHAPAWTRYKLINSSNNRVHVVVMGAVPSFEVGPHSSAYDPGLIAWETTGLVYVVTEIGRHGSATLSCRVDGAKNIRSVTDGDTVTLTYPPAPPCEANPDAQLPGPASARTKPARPKG